MYTNKPRKAFSVDTILELQNNPIPTLTPVPKGLCPQEVPPTCDVTVAIQNVEQSLPELLSTVSAHGTDEQRGDCAALVESVMDRDWKSARRAAQRLHAPNCQKFNAQPGVLQNAAYRMSVCTRRVVAAVKRQKKQALAQSDAQFLLDTAIQVKKDLGKAAAILMQHGTKAQQHAMVLAGENVLRAEYAGAYLKISALTDDDPRNKALPLRARSALAVVIAQLHVLATR